MLKITICPVLFITILLFTTCSESASRDNTATNEKKAAAGAGIKHKVVPALGEIKKNVGSKELRQFKKKFN
ncbi:MAG TPA: hypothetical protein VKS21_02305 [Spirochaetota bacterium]|nr:hypothetical protein [Spirochaetota bacterium]